ncbi:ESPR-type extended signal peptide-containing protein [Paraburkholderia kururiensis]|uniref:ESPR-type extended signal peptide-containing protein n=1 Tax=Paraburkholderia kururiensis TaxID=984307 RepID=UPI0030B9055F
MVFSRLRSMLVAVEETATSAGKAGQGETKAERPSMKAAAGAAISLFAMRHAAFGALMLAGVVPVALAQIVPTPGTSTHVKRAEARCIIVRPVCNLEG